MVDIDIETPRDGRYISEGDDQSRAPVAMIGNDVATKLFPNVDPIGREVLIDGRPFQVVGIGKAIGTAFGQSQDNFAYIPIQTYFKMYGTNDTLWVNIQASGPEWMERTQDEARPSCGDGGTSRPMSRTILAFWIRRRSCNFGRI